MPSRVFRTHPGLVVVDLKVQETNSKVLNMKKKHWLKLQ
jgi:hypothetical protein